MINTGLINSKSLLSNGMLQTTSGLSSTLQNVKDNVSVSSALQLATDKISITPPSLTGSAATNALSIVQTINTVGSPTFLYVNITNTASGGSTKFIDCIINSASLFSVDKLGGITGRYLQTSGAEGLILQSNVRIASSASGSLRLSNLSSNDFNLLQLGGTTSSFPALKRVGTELCARLADDSGLSFIEDLYRRKGTGSPETVVAAPVGAV